MSRSRIGLGLVLAVVAAGGVAAAVLPESDASIAVTVPPCAVSRLSPVYVSSTGAAGSVDREYGFRNRTTRRCVLRGYPTVQMLTGSGARLSTTEQHAPGAFGIRMRTVTLGRNEVAYFGVHYAAATGFGGLRCPTSAALRLTPPGAGASVVLGGGGARIQPYGGNIPHLHCGILHVSAVSGSRFQ